MAQLYINFGISQRLLNYIITTYPLAPLVEQDATHFILDVTAMTQAQINTMLTDLRGRLVEQI